MDNNEQTTTAVDVWTSDDPITAQRYAPATLVVTDDGTLLVYGPDGETVIEEFPRPNWYKAVVT